MPSSKETEILIVEDDALVRYLLGTLVAQWRPGIVISHAASVAEARVVITERRPRVVLMDIGLPDGDGIALTREVCDAAPGTKVIMVTFHKGEQYEWMAREAGAFAYVCKEEVDSALRPQLERALGGSGKERVDEA